MGTSALDAARNSCATVVLTPVRYGLDKGKCYYRWIDESKGYSLGEYPGLDDNTHQIKREFDDIFDEFLSKEDIAEKCYQYTHRFDENIVFKKIFSRGMPNKIDKIFLRRIRFFYYYKKMISIYVKLRSILCTT